MSPQNTAELQINAELKAWIDPLLPEEFAQLEANILAEGCRDPIVVWKGFILDGHNRYEICRRHGLRFAAVEKDGLVTREDALVWMAQNQLGRRNLSDFTRAALALQLKPLIERRAQQRMLAGRAAPSDPTQKSAEGSGETREAIAKAAGVSRDTVRKVEKILGSGNAEVTAQVRAGEISINAAAKKVAPPRAPAVVVPAARPSLVQQVQEQQATSDAATTAHMNTDAPDFGAAALAAPAVVSLDTLVDPDDAEAPDTVELLIAAEKKVERLEAEAVELRARVAMLEAEDLGSKIVKLEADVRIAADRANRYYEDFTKANNTAMRRKKRLDDIRRAAGLGADVDLVVWAKQAARRAA